MTDNAGATGSSTVTITVDPAVATTTMRVAAIDMARTVYTNGAASAAASVRVVDEAGQPVAGAYVMGTWSGLTNRTTSASTDAGGKARFASGTTSAMTGSFTFTINRITRTGFTYAPQTNTETSDSIAR